MLIVWSEITRFHVNVDTTEIQRLIFSWWILTRGIMLNLTRTQEYTRIVCTKKKNSIKIHVRVKTNIIGKFQNKRVRIERNQTRLNRKRFVFSLEKNNR